MDTTQNLKKTMKMKDFDKNVTVDYHTDLYTLPYESNTIQSLHTCGLISWVSLSSLCSWSVMSLYQLVQCF